VTRPDPELLALLAALLVPRGEAERLLARAPPGAAATATALRAQGREVMLRKLGRAGRPDWADQRRRAASGAAPERPRLAELLRGAAEGAAPPGGVAPLLLRLVRERLASDAG